MFHLRRKEIELDEKDHSLVLNDFKCTVCGEVFEAFSSPSGEDFICIECGGKAERIWINAPTVNAPSEYYDIGLGCVVTSPRHKYNLLKQRGLREIGDKMDCLE